VYSCVICIHVILNPVGTLALLPGTRLVCWPCGRVQGYTQRLTEILTLVTNIIQLWLYSTIKQMFAVYMTGTVGTNLAEHYH